MVLNHAPLPLLTNEHRTRKDKPLNQLCYCIFCGNVVGRLDLRLKKTDLIFLCFRGDASDFRGNPSIHYKYSGANVAPMAVP